MESNVNLFEGLVNLRKILTFLLLYSYFAIGIASPTSHDFENCQKYSLKVLELCFKKQSYYKNKVCWKMSQTSYFACYKRVMKQYGRKR